MNSKYVHVTSKLIDAVNALSDEVADTEIDAANILMDMSYEIKHDGDYYSARLVSGVKGDYDDLDGEYTNIKIRLNKEIVVKLKTLCDILLNLK